MNLRRIIMAAGLALAATGLTTAAEARPRFDHGHGWHDRGHYGRGYSRGYGRGYARWDNRGYRGHHYGWRNNQRGDWRRHGGYYR